jgi:heparosan-N-sulfate-glucuronate 5-epimerase
MTKKPPSGALIDTRAGRRKLRGLLRSQAGNPDAFGSERSFSPQIGCNWKVSNPVRGCYIDFRFKAEAPRWPPYWLAPLSEQLHIATVQWGLGAYERFVNDEGDQWLDAALAAAEHLLDIQHRGGPQDGGWRHFFSMPHTYRIEPPWLSAIAQGGAASLLVRLHLQTGDERFAESARRALAPMSVPVEEGGVLAELDGGPFVEEYPTNPPSLVLNGAVFALWGYRDVGVGLGDGEALQRFETLTSTLAANLDRWDTGHWSRYDLYPHPVPNVASPAYHLLHIRQLEVLDRLSTRPEIREVMNRFEDYRGSPDYRRRAIAQKVAFRLVVPRNAALAQRLPWNNAVRRGANGRAGAEDVLVLCYHAVSEDWNGVLAVTPDQLDAQLAYLGTQGFRGVTFSEAVGSREGGRRVAITFDDGYRSVARLAKPILDAHGLPATVFVPTDFVGTERPVSWAGIDDWLNGPHANELIPMSWQEATTLAESGWEIGSHTRSHAQLTKLDDVRLQAELEGSRAECERHLGSPCKSLAYPYGDVDTRVMEAAMATGYSAAAGVAAGPGRAAHYCWPRVGVYRADGHRSFQLKASRAVRTLQRSRSWGSVEAVVRHFRPHEPAVR